jgi:hypothetical protein
VEVVVVVVVEVEVEVEVLLKLEVEVLLKLEVEQVIQKKRVPIHVIPNASVQKELSVTQTLKHVKQKRLNRVEVQIV